MAQHKPAPVDCKECSRQFSTFKLYIKHLLAKECGAAQKSPSKTSPKSAGKILSTRSPRVELSSSPPDDIQVLGESISDKNTQKTNSKVTVIAPKKQQAQKEACTLCGKMCKGARGLSSHITACHTCQYCSENFNELEVHVRSVHEAEQCDECKRRFSTKDDLQKHMKEEHLVKCDVCEEEFYSETAMKEHRREEHEMEDCDMCDERFLKEDKLLESHLETEHGIKTKTVKQFSGGMMFMMVE